ncbi:tRNA (adenosine(37)-N6)-threonylcarbamoyltransferase complex ATPase subunit type 1 TsaE [uncultured Dokdonia sp.]|uniref:tRNA (adenosine(37)-N6)-threonylcarbamoyltransferase complex ATPase subunit type 1 TsaE n=1 Tax=uncultured Dokdonia sp. TaxID=575653 RepID=UPI002613A344|nr:tRNA (adenosine(37)-N6)-threonylcarbamoyltransferase complex ATPase subunit type 1 TsaE [uncultured Dokdonia sp.]
MEITYILSQIDSISARIIEATKSTVLLFYGDMGVGKTTLITSLAKQLGVTENVSSPTFSIVNEYQTSEGKRIFHFDAYRIEQEEEILDIGFEEYIEQGDWIFIEWPEKIRSFIPKNNQKIHISMNEIGERLIKLT